MLKACSSHCKMLQLVIKSYGPIQATCGSEDTSHGWVELVAALLVQDQLPELCVDSHVVKGTVGCVPTARIPTSLHQK